MSVLAPRFGFGIGLGRGYGAPTQGGGGTPQPSPGYFFLRAKQSDGSYVNLTGLNAENSRSTLQGKAA